MKDIRTALRGFLLADSAVNAACGGRIFPSRLPQGEVRPSLVYTRISGQGDNKMDGATGLSRPRVQIDAWSQSADLASVLANAVKDRLDGYKGDMSPANSPADPMFVQGIFYESERDGYDNDAQLYFMSRDYFVWTEER